MPLKLFFENAQKIRLYDPNLTTNFKIYILRLIPFLLIFGSLLYFVGFFHPSYQLYCEGKTGSAATGCRLTSTYYFLIPWHTQLGEVESASFQINDKSRRNMLRNSCGEIVLLTRIFANSMSYLSDNYKKISFYLSCNNLSELKTIAEEINVYLREKDVKKFNVPSLPNTLEQYLCIIGFLVVLLYQSKRIETSLIRI